MRISKLNIWKAVQDDSQTEPSRALLYWVFSPFLIFRPRPRRAGCGNAEETTVHFFCIFAQKEVCATHLCRLPFAFSEQALQAAFCSLYMHLRGKWGISKGIFPLALGHPIGARSFPVGTRFSFGKSSVLYLLRPLTRERGCPTPDRQFPASAEQADFVGCKLQKTRNLPWAKSGCSGVVGAGYLVAVRKDFMCQRGRKRYIKTRRSDTLNFPRLRGAQELVWQAAGTVRKYSRPLLSSFLCRQ